MKNYELMLIISPTIWEEERNKTISNLKNILEKNWAKIEKEDIWGERKLAYKINKQDKGFYILYYISVDGKKILDMTKEINLDKNIFRHMFVKQN